MHIEAGAPARTGDGDEVGSIDRLVIDPDTGSVVVAVLRTAGLTTRLVEVPLEALQAEADGTVTVLYEVEELDDLPAFDEARYLAPTLEPPAAAGLGGTGAAGASGYGLATAATGDDQTFDPAAMQAADEAAEQQTLAQAVVGPGATVLGKDGAPVGEVRAIGFDEVTGAISRLVVGGGVGGEEREVPAALIAAVDDGVISLTVDAGALPATER